MARRRPPPRAAPKGGKGLPGAAGTEVRQALEHGLALHRAGRLEEAARIYRRLLARHPGLPDGLHLLGVVAHQSGNPEEAVSLIGQAVAANPRAPEFFNNLGEAQRALGDLNAAVKSYRRALALQPNYPAAHNNLGNALAALGQHAKAIDSYRRAIAVRPNDALAHYNLGNALAAEGRLDEAIESYRRSLELSPHSAEAHANLGQALRSSGATDEAIEHHLTAVRLKPDLHESHNGLGVALHEKGDLDRALHHLRRAVTLKPDYADAHLNMGNVLRDRGAVDEAEASYREALRIRPGYTKAAYNLALQLEKRHRLEEAQEALERAQETAPDDASGILILLLAARLKRRTGRLSEAREEFEALLDRGLDHEAHAKVRAELGRLCEQLGDTGAAFANFVAGHEAKAAMPQVRKVDRGAFLERVANNRRWFTRQRVKGWPKRSADGGPAPIFLVGFPRSGTTLSEQILASHPNLVTGDELPLIAGLIKELKTRPGAARAYPDCLKGLGPAEVRDLRAAYWAGVEDRLGGLEGGKRFVDKLPLNIVDLGLVRRLFPESPVLVALRDPRDVCLSCFMQDFLVNVATVHFLRLEDTARLYGAVMDLWLHYRDCLGLRYLAFRYEDLVDDLEVTARRLIAFLGEPWSRAVMDYRAKAKRRYVSTPSYEDVTRPVFKRAVGRWRRYREQLAPVLPLLAPYVEAFGYAAPSDGELPMEGAIVEREAAPGGQGAGKGAREL